MSEMIERVALATCSSAPCICKHKSGFEGMPCLERGLRAVEAMRIPTDAMVKAGIEEVNWAREVYTAMIDEAMKS